MADDLRQLVARERKLRYGSVRQAAAAGGVSNTRWGAYEAGDIDVTDAIRKGVAAAFGWERDWPENPPVALPHADGPGAHLPTLAELTALADAAVDRALDAISADSDAEHAVLTGVMTKATADVVKALRAVERRLLAVEKKLDTSLERAPRAGR